MTIKFVIIHQPVNFLSHAQEIAFSLNIIYQGGEGDLGVYFFETHYYLLHSIDPGPLPGVENEDPQRFDGAAMPTYQWHQALS